MNVRENARVRMFCFCSGLSKRCLCPRILLVEVVELVGLITCERVVYRHRAILSFSVCAEVLVLGGSDHMEDDDQDRGDEENGQKV